MLPKENIIEIYEIPYTTTVEAVIDKIIELSKAGKLREIADVRDETDLSGLCIAIDCKRGVDPDRLMARLFKLTTLEDSFSCNFNILINGTPKVMGIREILNEWTAFRADCVRRCITYDLGNLQEKLHLLEGLRIILLDIDKAVSIIKNTQEDNEVVPNLMIGFGIDEAQAEYIAEIRLRALNRELVLKRLAEVEELRAEIERLSGILSSESKLTALIVQQLKEVRDRYGAPRRTEIVYEDTVLPDQPEPVEDYPVVVFFSREGYLKKITPQSLRMASEQRLKEGDEIAQSFETTNRARAFGVHLGAPGLQGTPARAGGHQGVGHGPVFALAPWHGGGGDGGGRLCHGRLRGPPVLFLPKRQGRTRAPVGLCHQDQP